jgi:hypothetical protein
MAASLISSTILALLRLFKVQTLCLTQSPGSKNREAYGGDARPSHAEPAGTQRKIGNKASLTVSQKVLQTVTPARVRQINSGGSPEVRELRTDSLFHGNDEKERFATSYELIKFGKREKKLS